jgi:hypothetical protein
MAQVGEDFRVNDIQEWRENGVLLTRFRPEFTYSVTERNQKIVEALMADGKAQVVKIVAPGGTNVVAGKSKATGSVGTKSKKGQ